MDLKQQLTTESGFVSISDVLSREGTFWIANEPSGIFLSTMSFIQECWTEFALKSTEVKLWHTSEWDPVKEQYWSHAVRIASMQA